LESAARDAETSPGSSASDAAALQAFWSFYEPRCAVIGGQIVRQLGDQSCLIRFVSECEGLVDSELPALRSAAIARDDRRPSLACLRTWGERCAFAGVAYADWFVVFRMYRAAVRGALAELGDDPLGTRRTLVVMQGLEQLLDAISEQIGEAYLASEA